MRNSRLNATVLLAFILFLLAACGSSVDVVGPEADGDMEQDGDTDSADLTDKESELTADGDASEAGEELEGAENAENELESDVPAESETSETVDGETPENGDAESPESGDGDLENEAQNENEGDGELEGEVPPCDLPSMTCDGVCTDVKHDAKHCGDCVTSCPVNKVCAEGNCEYDCPVYLTPCQNGCVDITSDPNNCGGCKSSCDLPNAIEGCAAQNCTIDSCKEGFGNCNTDTMDGCEVNLTNDVNNCGDCNAVCDLANASPSCLDKKCAISVCDLGFQSCNGDPADGCEINTTNDVNNCDGCGKVCALPHATPICLNSTCAIGRCDDGWADCDQDPSNGCEVNTTNDITNCNGCGNVCSAPANSIATCSGGVCGNAGCTAGWADCNNSTTDGCEVNTVTDPHNCSGCAKACTFPNASAGCSDSSCFIESCNQGYKNCNRSLADGCEVAYLSDVNNCGDCGNVCPALPNGASACAGGQCGLGTCNAGYKNCDNNTANGCEMNIYTNVNNCGTCNNVCNLAFANNTCSGGRCAIASCKADHQDCNGAAIDGCEVYTATDPHNCGGCGRQCTIANGEAGCAGSNCTVALCNRGYANCNQLVADGCEINIATDSRNCGSCTRACAVGLRCVDGNCIL